MKNMKKYQSNIVDRKFEFWQRKSFENLCSTFLKGLLLCQLSKYNKFIWPCCISIDKFKLILNPTCGNFKTQMTLVQSGIGVDGCVSGEEDYESTQVFPRGGSKSIFHSLRSFNNYMDQILPNFDPLSSRVDKHGHCT